MTGRDKYGVDEFKLTYLGQECTYNPNMLGKSAVAAVLPNILGNGNAIYVDKLFLSLSETTRVFVIAHELGHVAAGHMSVSLKKLIIMNSIRRYVCPFNPATRKEFEADRYALNYLTKDECISSLKELMKLDLGFIAKLEFFCRIKEMENVIWE